MKRKTLIFILTMALMITCLSVPAFADELNGNEEIEDAVLTELAESDSEIAVPNETAAEDTKKAEEEDSLAAPVLKKKMESTHRVVLKWNKVEDAAGYIVYKYNADKDKFSAFKSLGSSKSKYLMKNVVPGQKTVYAVKAYTREKGKVVVGKTSNTLKVKTPKVLKQSSKGFKQTNAYKVIKAAKKKLGCAYVSGAAGPRSFDCSGYTFYIYNKVASVKKIGSKKFTRSSAQGNYSELKSYDIGRDVSKAQPGDIMLFSRSGGHSGIYHAALYYGGGKIIHASSPSTGVIISPIAHRKVEAIIRLPKM
jgi:cell wall-associated NlpC family hydrolase